MTYEGMDTEAIRAVATQLNAQAAELASLIGAIEGLLGRALHEWDGQDAHDFQGWWSGQHRPRLQALHQDLATAAGGLAQQVAQQEQASGAGSVGQVAPFNGRADLPATAGNGLKTAFDAGERLNEGYGIAATTAGAATYLLTHQMVGRYGEGTTKAFWDSSSFMHWKTSSAVHGFQEYVKGSSAISKDAPEASQALGRFDGVSKGITVLSAAKSGVDIGNDMAQGDGLNASLDSASAAATIAKSAKGNPVAYLAGVATQSWVEVGKQAQKADFSASGVALTANYIRHDFWGAVGAGAQADVEYIPGALLRIFG